MPEEFIKPPRENRMREKKEAEERNEPSTSNLQLWEPQSRVANNKAVEWSEIARKNFSYAKHFSTQSVNGVETPPLDGGEVNKKMRAKHNRAILRFAYWECEAIVVDNRSCKKGKLSVTTNKWQNTYEVMDC